MLVSISRACDVLGVCAKILYRWEARGYIIPYRTPGNHRWYDYDALVEFRESCVYDPRPEAKTGVAAVYARVSSARQKEDLARQVEFLTGRARRDGFRVRVYSNVGSGLNEARPRLLKLLRDGLSCRFDRVYITFLDRLARFGTRPLMEVLKVAGVEVTAVHVPAQQTFEEALAADIIAVVTSFAGKMHRRRRGRNSTSPTPVAGTKTIPSAPGARAHDIHYLASCWSSSAFHTSPPSRARRPIYRYGKRGRKHRVPRGGEQ